MFLLLSDFPLFICCNNISFCIYVCAIVYSQEASFVLLVFRRTWATPETRLMQLGNPWWSRCVGSSVCFCLSSGKYWEWCMYIYLYDSISLIVYSTAFASVQPPHLSSRFIKQTIELIAIEITHLLVLANLKCMYVHTYVKKQFFSARLHLIRIWLGITEVHRLS